MAVAVENQTLIVSFVHAPAAGAPGQAGECSLADRPFTDKEPTELVYTGGGQTAVDLATLATQPVPFSLLAAPNAGTLQVASLLTQVGAGGPGDASNGMDAGSSADVYAAAGAATNYDATGQAGAMGPGGGLGLGADASAGPGGEASAGGPGMEANVTGPGSDANAGTTAESYSAGPGSEGPGSEGPGMGPGSLGPGMGPGALGPGMDANALGPGWDANGPGAEGPGAQANVADYGPGAALLPTDFSGDWRISGNFGEHFSLTLKESADGAVTGTYFAGKPGTYPRGDILAGRATGNQLLAQYKYQAKKGKSDTGQILFTITGPGSLTAMWTDGDVLPTPDSAGGTWDGVRSDGASQPQ